MEKVTWQQFGLKKNPYDTLPLIEGGDLAIEKAFVGRIEEMNMLNRLFESSERLCVAICGNTGVGKTSLANFHKFLWKYTHKQKLLFSFRREIEASDNVLDKRSFLIEIIGSVLRELQLMQPELLKEELLQKLTYIVDISKESTLTGGGLSVGGFGFDLSREKTASQPIQLSIAMLEQYFILLVEFIRKTKIRDKVYNGLIVHVNNFDIVLEEENGKKRVIQFFQEMRDLLQTPNVYFLFLGPRNLFKDVISSQKRIKSVFVQTPIVVEPLSKTEIIQAFDERMNLLKSDDIVRYIKPIDDEVIFRLYDLYEGDIRLIMSALGDILNQWPGAAAKSLSIAEAMLLLGRERWGTIPSSVLTPEKKKILVYLIQSGKYISQKEVAQLFNKAETNISSYYFKDLKERNIIEEKGNKGKMIYWGLTKNYEPLQFFLESQNKIKDNIISQAEQLSLFDEKINSH